MAKLTINQMENIEKERRDRARELDRGLALKHFPREMRKAPKLDITVYQLQLPQTLRREDTLKLYRRVVSSISYYREKWNSGNTLVAIVGFSEHRKWAPYTVVYGKKGGGRRKVFTHSDTAKRTPHVHIYLAGNNARKLAEIIWQAQRGYWKKHYPKASFPTFNNFAYSTHHFPIHYVKEQSTYTRSFGDVDSYIENHLVDNEPLDFDG